MAARDLATAPSSEELKSCVMFLQRGPFEPEGLAPGSKQRRIQLCPYCTVTHGEVIIRAHALAPNEFPKRLIFLNCHVFLVDAMSLLTTLPASGDEREMWPDVRREYNTCSDTSDHPSHITDEELLLQLIHSLAGIGRICLKFTRKNITFPASTRFGTNGAWPTSITDILPGNSSRSALVNFLRCWSRHSLGLMLFFLLQTLLQRPKIAHDLGTIAQVFPTAEISSHKFITGYEYQLNAALDEAARAENFCSEPVTPLITAIRLGLLSNRNNLSVAGLEASRVPALNATLDDLHTEEDAYTRFYGIASLLSRESKCWARGCQRYGGEESLKLMRCARCRAVQYCSKECQRLHWKSTVLPHKADCAMLARIQDISILLGRP